MALDADRNNVDIEQLLEKLRARGISSILVEGGPTTLRSFLEASAIDWLQLHTSPILFGSGKDVLTLPAIESVDDALQLRNAFYVAVGNGMMITGQV